MHPTTTTSLVGLAITAATAVVLLLTGRQDPPPAERDPAVRSPGSPTVLRASTQDTTSGEGPVSSRARARAEDPRDRRGRAIRRRRAPAVRDARSVVRRFLTALLARGAGRGPTRLRLERTATSGLARRLTAERPRPIWGRRAGSGRRLLDMELLRAGRDEVEFVATVGPRPGPSGLLVEVVRRGGRWRVAAVR